MWHVNYRVLNVMGGRTGNVNAQDQDQLKLSELFKRIADLCDAGDNNGLVQFDVTRTTLEQVFITFARFQHNMHADLDANESDEESEEVVVAQPEV